MGKIATFIIIAMIVLTFLVIVGGLSINSNLNNVTFERITTFLNGYNYNAIGLDVNTVTIPNITADWGIWNFLKDGLNIIINTISGVMKIASIIASGIWNALQFVFSILEGI